MQLPNDTIVAVADGEKLNLFRNRGDEGELKLEAMPAGDIDNNNKGSGSRHQSSAANPSDSQIEEDSFAAGVAERLNRETTAGRVTNIVVIAAPRTLGELRKHYHKTLSAALLGEVAKDLTGHSLADVEKAIKAA